MYLISQRTNVDIYRRQAKQIGEYLADESTFTYFLNIKSTKNFCVLLKLFLHLTEEWKVLSLTFNSREN